VILPGTPDEAALRQLYNELQPGDRVEVEHEVKVGLKRWPATTVGAVVRKERRREGLHFRRNPDDKVWADVLVLQRESGELTTVTMDEFTRMKKLA
jgi:hypothetical protein